MRRSVVLTSWAVIATGKHLFPFRTEKLSPLAPMVLGEQSPGRVGRRPFLSKGPARGLSRSSGRSELLAPARVERAQPAYPLVEWWVRHEQRRESLVRRTDSSCRAARSPGSPRTGRAPSPARGAAARRRARAASRRARLRGGRPRTRASATGAGGRTPQRPARSRRAATRCSAPPMRENSTAVVGDDHRDRLHEDVAVAEVGDLVRDDPLELCRRGDAEEPDRDREPAAAACAAAGRQGARVAVREDVEARLDDAAPASDSRSTVECSAGASPSTSSRAPTIPITIRSAYA